MMDGFQCLKCSQAPFDYNTFDHLPLSLAAPNTHSQRLPPKLQKMSFTFIDNFKNNQMAHLNFKALFARIDKAMKACVDD